MALRLLVTGSRDWHDYNCIDHYLRVFYEAAGSNPASILVHGACPRGADEIAQRIWLFNGLQDEPHPAQWDLYGKKAGFLRNKEMVTLGADYCLAFIKNKSRGASHTASLAEQAGIDTMRIEMP